MFNWCCSFLPVSVLHWCGLRQSLIVRIGRECRVEDSSSSFSLSGPVFMGVWGSNKRGNLLQMVSDDRTRSAIIKNANGVRVRRGSPTLLYQREEDDHGKHRTESEHCFRRGKPGQPEVLIFC